MALDSLRQAAQGVAIGNLRRVAGNLPGMLGGSKGDNSSKYKKLNRAKSPHSLDNLSFPIDVDSDPGLGNHGHYMMFYIHQQDHAKLKFGDPAEPKQSGADNTIKATKQANLPEEKNEVQTIKTGLATESKYAPSQWNNKIGMQLNNNVSSDSRKTGASGFGQGKAGGGGEKRHLKYTKDAQAIHVKRASTTKMKTAIALYMPASVQVQYGANYTDTEIGSMAERAAEVLKDFAGGNKAEGFSKILNADSDLVKNAGQFLLAGVGNIPGFGGAKELEAMKKGRIISNRMELAFKGINKREFQYTFKMMPRNQRESDEIKKIVHAFKFNMLPEFEGSDLSGRSFIVPNIFEIEYMYNGKQNQYLHKISKCVLESMSVTYGGDRYKTYTATAEGAPPQETTLSLNFKEMEMITRERVELGF
jgi:hypothetical protein